MKRIIVVVAIMAIIFGCEKDDPKTENDNTDNKSSNSNNKSVKYKANLVLKDIDLAITGSPEDIIVTDIDNDKDSDIIMIERKRKNFLFTNNTLIVFKNSGNGSFTKVDMNDNFTKFNIHNYDVADYNNDGYKDLVIQKRQSGSIAEGQQALIFYKNNAGRSFEYDVTIKFKDVVNCFWMNDFNNDNKQDIVILSKRGLQLYKCKENANYGSAELLINTDKVSDIRILDINGDKLPDMSLYNFSDRKYYIYANDKGKLNKLYSFAGVYKACYSDIDNDGSIDVALIGDGADRGIYKQVKGKIIKIFDLPVMENGGAEWCDINGDNRAELITSFCKDFMHYVRIYDNKNGDTFQDNKQTLFPDNKIPLKHGNDFIVVSDINGDKKEDILISAYTKSNVKRTLSAIINKYTKIE